MSIEMEDPTTERAPLNPGAGRDLEWARMVRADFARRSAAGERDLHRNMLTEYHINARVFYAVLKGELFPEPEEEEEPALPPPPPTSSIWDVERAKKEALLATLPPRQGTPEQRAAWAHALRELVHRNHMDSARSAWITAKDVAAYYHVSANYINQVLRGVIYPDPTPDPASTVTEAELIEDDLEEATMTAGERTIEEQAAMERATLGAIVQQQEAAPTATPTAEEAGATWTTWRARHVPVLAAGSPIAPVLQEAAGDAKILHTRLRHLHGRPDAQALVGGVVLDQALHMTEELELILDFLSRLQELRAARHHTI